MNAWKDYFSHRIAVPKELDAHFNFQTMHLMSHWVKQICRYRVLQQYSADRHEQAYKTNLKDGLNAPNHNLNCLPQVITFQPLILSFEIRQLNLQALNQCRENRAAACKSLPSGAGLCAHLGTQSYVKPGFTGPQNRRDGQHPNTMIKDFRALLNNTHDATHCMAIYSGR